MHELYHQFHIIPIQAYSGMRVKKNSPSRTLNKEVLITNFTISQGKGQGDNLGQLHLLEETFRYGDNGATA